MEAPSDGLLTENDLVPIGGLPYETEGDTRLLS